MCVWQPDTEDMIYRVIWKLINNYVRKLNGAFKKKTWFFLWAWVKIHENTQECPDAFYQASKEHFKISLIELGAEKIALV